MGHELTEQGLNSRIFRRYRIFKGFNNHIYNLSENLNFGGADFALK